MNRIVLIVVVITLLILGAGAWFLMNSNKAGTPVSQVDQTAFPPSTGAAVTSESSPSSGSVSSGQVKEFTVTGSSFKFEPSTLAVNKGDKVRIIFKNSGGNHDFVIDELNVRSKTIASGESETVEFTADKAGSFEYYCAIGNHRAMGVKGTLTVN